MKPFSNMELSSFCGQNALILKAGTAPLEGLLILQEDASCGEKEVLDALIQNMQKTESLYEACASVRIFPPYMLHMLQIGEETGALDTVLESLQEHYAREDAVSRNIRSFFTYALMLTGMLAAVVIVLLVKVLPVFNQVFIELGSEMTGFSRTLMNAGTAIQRCSGVLLFLLAAAAGFLLYGTKTDPGRRMFRRLGRKLPFTKMIYEETAACRFASGLALTLSSGLPPKRSMELAVSLNDDPAFRQKTERCLREIRQDADLPQALLHAGIFTGIYARMAAIGSKTGSMEQSLKKLAELYQEDIDARTNNVLAVLEPALAVFVSLFAGVVLLSVMLPLIGILSGI